MSSRRKTKGSKEKETMTDAQPKIVSPSGRMPSPKVNTRHNGGMVTRAARGFSLTELEAAGIDVRHARSFRLPVDPFRRSSVGPNVEGLKTWYVPGKAAPAEATQAPEKKPHVGKKTRTKKAPRKKPTKP
ncbi:MAG: ribosomal protein L13e [Thaumarchaeota archaeon]|nr:ribosomal protein L13e [Nitrososphaerota archaeon]